MIIVIETHGHQQYSKIEGEVLLWTTTTERYHDQGGAVFQVPAVLLSAGDRVHLIPLKTERTWTEIRVATTEAMGS